MKIWTLQKSAFKNRGNGVRICTFSIKIQAKLNIFSKPRYPKSLKITIWSVVFSKLDENLDLARVSFQKPRKLGQNSNISSQKSSQMGQTCHIFSFHGGTTLVLYCPAGGKKVEKWAKNVQNYSPIHRNSFYHGKIHSQKHALKIGDFDPKNARF